MHILGSFLPFIRKAYDPFNVTPTTSTSQAPTITTSTSQAPTTTTSQVTTITPYKPQAAPTPRVNIGKFYIKYDLIKNK